MKSIKEYCESHNLNEILEMYSEHNDKTAAEIPFFTKEKVKWRCARGHIFDAIPRNLIGRKYLCEYCKRLEANMNLKEYCEAYGKKKLLDMYSTQNELKAEKISAVSQKVVLWVCEKGHEFRESPAVMIKRVRLCLQCRTAISFIDYCQANGKSELLGMYSKENAIPIENLSASDRRIVSWRCKNGHLTMASVYDMRRRKKYLCQWCKGSIAETYPQYEKYWDEKANGVSSRDVPATYLFSHYYHWVCAKGHKWVRRLQSIIPEDRFCPVCNKQGRLLIYAYPEIASAWDIEHNDADISLVTIGNSKLNACWICSQCGKKFNRTVRRQIRYGSLCTECYAKSKRKK